MALCDGRPEFSRADEVFDVKTVQHSPLGGGVKESVFIASPNQPAAQGGQNVDAPAPQGDDECVLHRILVEVQPNSAHPGDWDSDSRATFSANASSSARSASISSGLA